MKKLLALSLVLIFVLSLPFTASAATKDLTYKIGAGKSEFFNVVTTKKGATINFSMGSGKLYLDNLAGSNFEVNVYGAYEIKISQLKDGNWTTFAKKKDIYNKASDKITLGEAGTYKIQIYQWAALTTAKSYLNKNITCADGGKITNKLTHGFASTLQIARWNSAPSITAKAGTGIKSMYKSTRTGK